MILLILLFNLISAQDTFQTTYFRSDFKNGISKTVEESFSSNDPNIKIDFLELDLYIKLKAKCATRIIDSFLIKTYPSYSYQNIHINTLYADINDIEGKVTVCGIKDSKGLFVDYSGSIKIEAKMSILEFDGFKRYKCECHLINKSNDKNYLFLKNENTDELFLQIIDK